MFKGTFSVGSIVLLCSCGSPVEPAWPRVAAFDLGTPAHLSQTFSPGQEVPLGQRIVWAKDPAGDVLTREQLRRIPDSVVGWAWHDRHPAAVMAVPTEPAHTGWEAVAPDFAEAGYLQNSRGGYQVCLHVWLTGTGPESLEGFGPAPYPDDMLPPP